MCTIHQSTLYTAKYNIVRIKRNNLYVVSRFRTHLVTVDLD